MKVLKVYLTSIYPNKRVWLLPLVGSISLLVTLLLRAEISRSQKVSEEFAPIVANSKLVENWFQHDCLKNLYLQV